MLFTSPSFLFLFLPFVIFLYAVTPNHYKKLALLIFNILFYLLLNVRNPTFVLVLLACIIYTYIAGREIRASGKRSLLILFVSLEMIAFFAYRIFLLDVDSDKMFFIPCTTLFFMASVSYMFDVYRKDTDINLSFIDMATFISFFPVSIAGPILKYKDFVLILEKRSFSVENFSRGAILFCLGFIKKVVVGVTVDEIFRGLFTGEGDGVTLQSFSFGAAIFLMKVIFELWGYSDMASGISLMLGFKLRKNFKYSSSSLGVTAFFERFFVSFKEWLYDYIYIPFSKKRTGISFFPLVLACIFGAFIIRTNTVMLCAGILVAAFIYVERRFEGRLKHGKKVFFTILSLFVATAFCTFLFLSMRADSLAEIAEYIEKIKFVAFDPRNDFIYVEFVNLKFAFVSVVVFAIFFKPIFEKIISVDRFKEFSSIYTLVHNLLTIIIFVFSIVYFLPQIQSEVSVAFDFIYL